MIEFPPAIEFALRMFAFGGVVWVVLWLTNRVEFFARPMDRLYRWVWRLPECRAGHCYCRRGCVCMVVCESPCQLYLDGLTCECKRKRWCE
jgi:hypothetical protein